MIPVIHLFHVWPTLYLHIAEKWIYQRSLDGIITFVSGRLAQTKEQNKLSQPFKCTHTQSFVFLLLTTSSTYLSSEYWAQSWPPPMPVDIYALSYHTLTW